MNWTGGDWFQLGSMPAPGPSLIRGTGHHVPVKWSRHSVGAAFRVAKLVFWTAVDVLYFLLFFFNLDHLHANIIWKKVVLVLGHFSIHCFFLKNMLLFIRKVRHFQKVFPLVVQLLLLTGWSFLLLCKKSESGDAGWSFSCRPSVSNLWNSRALRRASDLNGDHKIDFHVLINRKSTLNCLKYSEIKPAKAWHYKSYWQKFQIGTGKHNLPPLYCTLTVSICHFPT